MIWKAESETCGAANRTCVCEPSVEVKWIVIALSLGLLRK